MSIISETYGQMETARQLVQDIQDECSHPEAGLRQRDTGRSISVYQDGEDGYVGDFVQGWQSSITYTCGLCGHEWSKDVTKDDN